ncbi:syndecan-3 isoform X1 [Hyla sarda]|uniref:syndecan-3 isoform X1 n=2 Tax=Hyla sarda TaxID=327740 RepID=UPI0024C3438C|nr:syndecan-3 isoform X1 [Hyla sarda]
MHLAFGLLHGAGLLLLVSQAALAQRWRKEFEDEKPFDLESSGDDDFLDEDDTDDVYSGSGSGDFEMESRLDFGVRFTTETPIAPPTATALKPAPTVDILPSVQTTWLPPTTQATLVHRHHQWVLLEAPETPSITAAPTPTIPTKEAATTAAVTTATARTTEVRRLQPVIIVSTLTTIMPTTTEEETKEWDDISESFGTTPDQGSSQQWPTQEDITIQSTVVDDSEIEDLEEVTPTQQPQTDSWEVTIATARDTDIEVPVSGGPSGDFEIREEEEAFHTQPPTVLDLGNEVLPPGTSPTDHGRERKLDTGLIDNTIDSGNTLAQMPQKNILERREVLIAVIVGGVVGALFAAFLVMLLIYRMKKKDEGSYALEEPKPASVSYQKPDNHEEFYA